MFPFNVKFVCIFLLIAFSCSTAADVEVGQTVCAAGYIMDTFCIDRGTLLDNSKARTLEEPNLHSVHCLVDVGVCRDSPFEILLDPQSGESEYRRGFRVSNNDLLIDTARSIGECSTCTGDGDQKLGFYAEVTGTVLSLGDGSIPPLIEVTDAKNTAPGATVCQDFQQEQEQEEVVEEEEEEEETPSPTSRPTVTPTKVPTVSPTTEQSSADSPTMEPTSPSTIISNNLFDHSNGTNISSAMVDCVQFQQVFDVPDLPVTLSYVVNLDDGENSTTIGTFSAEIVYNGLGWIGFAISPDGMMINSLAVIGLPDDDTTTTNPGKYVLNSKDVGGVTQDGVQQTLQNATITQNGTHTILQFTKLLEEVGEISINGTGHNHFLVAYGSDNILGYHLGRASFSLMLEPCIDETTTTMNQTSSPSSDSTTTTPPVMVGRNPDDGSSSNSNTTSSTTSNLRPSSSSPPLSQSKETVISSDSSLTSTAAAESPTSDSISLRFDSSIISPIMMISTLYLSFVSVA